MIEKIWGNILLKIWIVKWKFTRFTSETKKIEDYGVYKDRNGWGCGLESCCSHKKQCFKNFWRSLLYEKYWIYWNELSNICKKTEDMTISIKYYYKILSNLEVDDLRRKHAYLLWIGRLPWTSSMKTLHILIFKKDWSKGWNLIYLTLILWYPETYSNEFQRRI